MWRRCDLHRHTTPNEKDGSGFDASVFVEACLQAKLDVVAVADHDQCTRFEEVRNAAVGTQLSVMAGIEVGTDRGHVVVLAPVQEASEVLEELRGRVDIRPDHQAEFDLLSDTVRSGTRPSGAPFRDSLILIGAHVDMPSSLLAPGQQLTQERQLENAARLDALEVARQQTYVDWLGGGVKQSDHPFALLSFSDWHGPDGSEARSTWIYLEAINTNELLHAFSTPESSIRMGAPPAGPSCWIRSIAFDGGMHDGLTFNFSPRANALIGPPSTGKSLLVDAIRFAFDCPCPIDEVEQTSAKRLERRLPDGSTVSLAIEHGAKSEVIKRVRGGAAPAEPPFRPIVFSQTELTRRAMEGAPSIDLVDVHCEAAAALKQKIADCSSDAASKLEEVIQMATRASDLAKEVRNPQDGLEATRKRVEDLTGGEPAAKTVNDLMRIARWRNDVLDSFARWATNPDVSPPLPPDLPALESGLKADEFLPENAIEVAIQKFDKSLDEASARLAQSVEKAINESSAKLKREKLTADEELAKSGVVAAELSEQLIDLRLRLTKLESSERELHDLESEIDRKLAVLIDITECAEEAHGDLQRARKEACSSVNSSMRAFLLKLEEGRDTSDLDAVLNDLKVGTNLWADTITSVREALDRRRILELAVRIAQGREDAIGKDAARANQDVIVQTALDRGKLRELAQVATMWPDDGAQLAEKPAKGSADPVPFSRLTEGMRALAIKEVSFAASHLPVVSDQPEDSVPTRAVFDTLVPTIRKQRAERQFIIVSHDANVVVTGDVERIIVLDPEADGGLVTGTLFDPEIRKYAMALLEGGEKAFELRRRRYGNR